MLDKNMFGEVPEVVHDRVVYTLELLDASMEKDSKMYENVHNTSYGKVTEMISGMMHRNSSDKVRHISSKKRWLNSRIRLPKAAVACLACLLVSGITVSAMGVVSLYRQRMEEMNAEMLEEFYQIADAGEATTFSRPYTNSEEIRHEELSLEYENEGVFPESQITYLENAEEYKGEGIGLDASSRTLYLPEEELSDEELLEIIDFEHKVSYSIYEQNEERIASGSDWQSRMAELDAQEIDEVYLTMFSGNSEISGAYSRELSAEENETYAELINCYEEEGVFAQEELAIIQTPEEYAGTGAAICVEDSTFYLPEDELTDEELLQIIDFEHKVTYCLEKINQEIDLGLREGYPQA